MSIGIVLSKPQDVRLVHWAARIARSRYQSLVIFWLLPRPNKSQSKRSSSRDHETVPPELEETCNELQTDFRFITNSPLQGESHTDVPKIPLEVISLASRQVRVDVANEISTLGIRCLVIPREPQLSRDSEHSQLIDYLLHHVACEVVLLTPGTQESGQCSHLVSPVGGGPHSASCLRMANDLAAASDATLTALHIEPELDIASQQAAANILKKSVHSALGNNQSRVRQRVVLNDDVVGGIHETLDESPDLIILGMKRTGLVQRFSSQGIADKLVNSNPGPTVAVLQSALPFSNLISRRINELLQGYVPQLGRNERISLVERIQSSSQWDFDFIMLIFMSTLIAAGGLIENSAAVVIGAMLVAPLMTPLLGTGLSITQGNWVLFRGTLLTVIRGFLLAFATSFAVGIFAAHEVTSEMAARGAPRLLDILVAMVGGIAAAYASGRPNLLSALPGVAIAASLVPPIATAGIAAWLGEYGLSGRAALLFLTNIVAIILGTWIAFRAVGIRGVHQHGQFDRWTISAGIALLLLVALMGAYEHQLGAKSEHHQLQQAINEMATQDSWSCTNVAVTNGGGGSQIHITLQGAQPLPERRMQQILSYVREPYGADAQIKITIVSE